MEHVHNETRGGDDLLPTSHPCQVKQRTPMKIRNYLLSLLCLVWFAHACAAVERVEGPFTCPLGRKYWVGFPHGYDPAKTYWPVVVGHGAKGSGEQTKNFALAGDRDDYIVIAPSFPNNQNDGFFQVLGGNADQQIIGIHKQLAAKYQLHPRFFLFGFSAGAQFSHRFTMAHPNLVIGCSAHSGGSWGPEMNPKAMALPLFVSCGLDDTDPSVPGDPPRLVAADNYFKQLLKAGYCLKPRYWQGFGHQPSPKVGELTAECYELATTGLFPEQRAVVTEAVAKIETLLAAGDPAPAKAAITALTKLKIPPMTRKSPARATLSPAEQEAQRADFVAAGIGGKSRLNKDFWVDDRNENSLGWNDNQAAQTWRATVAKNWILTQAQALAARVPKADKKP